jgi:type IV pilus assembly protein PilF
MNMSRERLLFALALAVSTLALAGCQRAGMLRDESGEGVVPGAQAPGREQVYIELAAAYLQEGQLGIALAKAQQAVAVNSSSTNAHNVLGLVYERMGEATKAEAEYQESIRLSPDNYFAHNAYGAFLCKQRRFAESDREFQAAIGNPLNQTPWVAMTNAAICAQDQGDRAGAERYYRDALQRNPRFAPGLLRMARFSVDGGDLQSARQYLDRYAAVAPPTAESLALGARVERQLGNRNKAASYERMLRERFPDSVEIQRLR